MIQKQMTEKELDFAVFCIENLAHALHSSGDIIYKKLTKDSSILEEYIIAHYDVLHTQGKDYIVNDIIDLMKERNLL